MLLSSPFSHLDLPACCWWVPVFGRGLKRRIDHVKCVFYFVDFSTICAVYFLWQIFLLYCEHGLIVPLTVQFLCKWLLKVSVALNWSYTVRFLIEHSYGKSENHQSIQSCHHWINEFHSKAFKILPRPATYNLYSFTWNFIFDGQFEENCPSCPFEFVGH